MPRTKDPNIKTPRKKPSEIGAVAKAASLRGRKDKPAAKRQGQGPKDNRAADKESKRERLIAKGIKAADAAWLAGEDKADATNETILLRRIAYHQKVKLPQAERDALVAQVAAGDCTTGQKVQRLSEAAQFGSTTKG